MLRWLQSLIGSTPVDLTPAQAERLAAWQALPRADLRRPWREMRMVVVDVESSGLDLRRDRLIAIGAIAMCNGTVALGDSLEIVLRQEQISGKDNILIHGIGGEAQREGVPPVDALLTFLEYLGRDPLLAFHVAFDDGMIRKALKHHLGLRLEHPWADLAYLAPALYAKLAGRCHSLDQWSQQFGIGNYARHSALADALATAELMLALKPPLTQQRIESFAQLRDIYLDGQRATAHSGGM